MHRTRCPAAPQEVLAVLGTAWNGHGQKLTQRQIASRTRPGKLGTSVHSGSRDSVFVLCMVHMILVYGHLCVS